MPDESANLVNSTKLVVAAADYFRDVGLHRQLTIKMDPKADAAKRAWLNQRRAYRQLRHTKSADYWNDKVEVNQSDPHKLWRMVDDLLGRGRTSPSSAIDLDVFSRVFADKVAKVRSSTDDAPTFTQVPPGVCFQQFRLLSTDGVISAIRRLPDKSSPADPVPTSVLKQIADIVTPFIVQLFSRSLCKGLFPATFKEASITPVLKKPGLDATSASSYRPISNLHCICSLETPGTPCRSSTDGVSVAD